MTAPALPGWAATLAALDDESLCAWASRGLLRRARKDLDEAKVTPVSQGEILELQVDDAKVVLSGPELAKARCSCPAHGGCRHILAGVLWLRSQGSAAKGAPATQEGPDALDRLLACDPEAILRRLPAGQRRQARELAWDEGWTLASRTPGSVGILLERKAWEIRWSPDEAGGRFVSDLPAARAGATHAAALLAVLRLHGKWTAPEEPETVVEAPVPSEILPLLESILASGMAHASGSHPDSLKALATQVRSQGRRSLAASLRQLAEVLGTMGTSGTTGSEGALAMARLLALQESAQEHPEPEPPPRELRALPLGAYWWETAAGARGATGLFADVADGTLHRLVLARPDRHDVTFRREGVWEGLPFWGGVSLASLSGRLHDLEAVQCRGDGSWKASSSTRSTSLGIPPAEDALWRRLGIADWAQVRTTLAGLAGSLQVELTHLLLRPASCEVPLLDEVEQVVHWRVRDEDGRPLLLELVRTPATSPRVHALSDFLSRPHERIVGICAAVRRIGLRLALEPVTLLLEDKGKVFCWSPDFERPPQAPKGLFGLFRRNVPFREPSDLKVSARPQVRTALQELLVPVLRELENRIELGQGSGPAPDFWQESSRRLALHGLSRLGARFAQGAASPFEAVRLAYLLRTLLELEVGEA